MGQRRADKTCDSCDEITGHLSSPSVVYRGACKLCRTGPSQLSEFAGRKLERMLKQGLKGQCGEVMDESQCDFCAAWRKKCECDNRNYVDYKPSCSAKDCTGAHEAPGGPHREDRCNRTRVRWVATFSSSL